MAHPTPVERPSALGPSRADLATSPLRQGMWLALALIIAKALCLDPTHLDWWIFDLPAVSFKDVIFALSLGIAGEMVLSCVSPQRRAYRLLQQVIIAICASCALYGVVAAGVFNYFGKPPSYDLLRLVRSVAAVKSSLSSQLTLPLITAFACVPGGYFALARYASYKRELPYLALSIVAAWITLGSWKYTTRDDEWRVRQLAINPHAEFLRSTWSALTRSARPSLPRDLPPEAKEEFRPVAERIKPPVPGFTVPPGVARPRNVIVVVLESVGTKYLSLYGSKYDTTPGLIAESNQALVFDHFYAQVPYTFCSFMALNFSIYPGLPWCYIPGDTFAPSGKRPLPPTLASLLQKRGSRTAYLHNGDLEWGGMDYVLKDQGYDNIEDYRAMKAPGLTSWGSEDRYLFDRLVSWIDEKPGQPFYAFCWTDQTHDPYEPSAGVPVIDFFHGQKPANRAEDLSRYLNVVHETDKQLTRLFNALRERGLADDTLVVITGDHGEAFTDPHEQRGHGFTIYQEDLNVPLVLWNPRLFPAGKRVDTIGGHVDLNSTLAEILALEIPGEWQGYSLFDPQRPQRAFFLANVGEYLFGVRDGRWKYSFAATDSRESLYDLTTDPTELHDVSKGNPERTQELRGRVAAWISFEDEFLRPSREPAKSLYTDVAAQP